MILTAAAALSAQKGIIAGYSIYLDYNLYQRYQQPKTNNQESVSSGQLLNVLPLGGLGVWVGKPEKRTIGIDAGFDFMPFSIGIDKFKGMGAVSFPVLLRFTAPFIKGIGISPFYSIGLGIQWNKINIFANKSVPNPYFPSYTAELNLGLGAGWLRTEKETGLISMFARVGYAPKSVFSLNIGLRAKLMFNPGGYKKSLDLQQKERLYQAMTDNRSVI